MGFSAASSSPASTEHKQRLCARIAERCSTLNSAFSGDLMLLLGTSASVEHQWIGRLNGLQGCTNQLAGVIETNTKGPNNENARTVTYNTSLPRGVSKLEPFAQRRSTLCLPLSIPEIQILFSYRLRMIQDSFGYSSGLFIDTYRSKKEDFISV